MKLLIKFILIVTFMFSQANAESFKYDGANCINNVLVKKGLTNYYRYSSLSEIRVFLDSPLCKTSQPNDYSDLPIGLVYSESPYADPEIIAHAFIRLDSILAQEKHGYSKSDPYQIVYLKKIFEDYELQNPEASVRYFSCMSLNTYLSANKISNVLLQKIDELNSIEAQLSKILSSPILSNEVVKLEAEIKIFSAQMVQICQTDGSCIESSSSKLITKMLAARLVSIAGQLNAVNFRSLRAKTFRWEFDLRDIEQVFNAIAN